MSTEDIRATAGLSSSGSSPQAVSPADAASIPVALRRVTRVNADDARNIYIDFAVVDERGGTHFHFRIDETPYPGDDRLCCAGVETHYASAPSYMRNDPPSHDKCWLLGGPCWHDGTSLWASEHWIPGFKRGGTEWVWRELERRHEEYFAAETPDDV